MRKWFKRSKRTEYGKQTRRKISKWCIILVLGCGVGKKILRGVCKSMKSLS